MKQQLEPQNLEAEKALLGAILMDPDCLNDVTEICQPEDFFRTEHQNIYSAFISLANSSQTIDILTVTDWLEGNGRMKNMDPEYVAALAADVPLASNAVEYAKIVSAKSMPRSSKPPRRSHA